MDGQHQHYLCRRHQSYLLQTGNESWLLPFLRQSCPTYHSVCSSVSLTVWLHPLSLHVSLLSLSRSFSLCLSVCLAGWLAGWLHPLSLHLSLLSLSRSFSLRPGWLADWLAGWLADWLTGWLADWLSDWLTGWLADWLANSLPSHSMSLPSLCRDLSGSLALSLSLFLLCLLSPRLSSVIPSLPSRLPLSISPTLSLPLFPHPLCFLYSLST